MAIKMKLNIGAAAKVNPKKKNLKNPHNNSTKQLSQTQQQVKTLLSGALIMFVTALLLSTQA